MPFGNSNMSISERHFIYYIFSDSIQIERPKLFSLIPVKAQRLRKITVHRSIMQPDRIQHSIQISLMNDKHFHQAVMNTVVIHLILH